MDPFDNGDRIPVCEIGEKYSVVIDEDLDFEDAIQAGGYNDVHPAIVPPAFWQTQTGRKETVDFYPFSIAKPMETDAVLQLMKEKGFAPAGIYALLAFGAQYPEVQWECPVIALGSRWKNRDGDGGVAYLWNNPFGRALLMAVIKKDRPWLANCRFAAVRLPGGFYQGGGS